MPSTSALQSLFHKRQISDAKWIALLEERKDFLKPYLDKVTLGTLGKVKCLDGGSLGSHALREVSFESPPIIVHGTEFSFETQGIFDLAYNSVEYTKQTDGFWGSVPIRDGRLCVWGLTRKAQWILARVNFVGTSGYKGSGYSQAREVWIDEADLPTFVSVGKVTPYEIWQTLSKEIARWNDERMRLYEDMRSLNETIQMQDLALSLVSGK